MPGVKMGGGRILERKNIGGMSRKVGRNYV